MGDGTLVTTKFAEFADFARMLEASASPPRAIVYAVHTDTDEERLLVVPQKKAFDQHETYRGLAVALAKNRSAFPSIDVSDIRLVPESDPYVKALSSLFRVEEFATITIEKSVLDGVYVEHAVIFRLAL